MANAVDDITKVLGIVHAADPGKLTPRQEQGLRGGEACIMLFAHPGKLDRAEMEILAKAGLIFGAVLAGER